MKYETGKTDSHGNRYYDWFKVCADMKKVVLGKIKFSKALYEVMNLRFTIAHYDRMGWLMYYNRNWAELAREIKQFPWYWGDIRLDQNETQELENFCTFLKVHNGFSAIEA
jgi:hypothetical protein